MEGNLAYIKRTTVRLPDELDARLRHEAERRGLNHVRTHSRSDRGSPRRSNGSTEVDRRRRWQERFTRRLNPRRRDLVPILVVTELVYLLGTRLGHDAEVRFLGHLAAGNLVPEHVAAEDWLRIAELVQIYHDLSLGSIDSSVMNTPVESAVGDQEVQGVDAIMKTSRDRPRLCGRCEPAGTGSARAAPIRAKALGRIGSLGTGRVLSSVVNSSTSWPERSSPLANTSRTASVPP